MTIHFEIPGAPVVWKRARRRGSQYFTDPKQADYQKAAAWAAKAGGAKVVHGPLCVAITFDMPMPSKVTGKKARAALEGTPAYSDRKDIDNLGKCILDALNGVAYVDDRQVCTLALAKRWSIKPRAFVTITPISEVTA